MALTQNQIDEYNLKEAEAEDIYDCVELAEALVAVGEKEWANKIYKEAESKYAEDDYNFCLKLAESLFNVNEVEWAKKIFSKAEKLGEGSFHLSHFARRINDILGDKEWAKKILVKAEAAAEDTYDCVELAKALVAVGEKEWAKKILLKVEDKASSSRDLDECEFLGSIDTEGADTCDSCGHYFFEEELEVKGLATHGDRVDWAFTENQLEFTETVNLTTIEFDFEEFDETCKQDPSETETSAESFGLIKFACPNCEKQYYFYCGEKDEIDRSFIPSNSFKTMEELIAEKSKHGINLNGRKFNIKFCFVIDDNTFKHRGGEQSFECNGFEDAIEQLLNSDAIEIGVQGFEHYAYYYDIEVLS